MGAHAAVAALHIDRATIDAVLEDWTTAPVSERVRAGLRLVEAMTRHPQDIDADFIASLGAAGLDTEAIEDAANVCFHLNLFNRLSDAIDFPVLDEAQRRKTAKMLDFAARNRGGRRPQPSFYRRADGILRPVEVESARANVLRLPGASEPALREPVEAAAATWLGGSRDIEQELPKPLDAYVEKVARWAYKVTDEDVDALKQAGYTEQAIFELTLAAALGAAVSALERVFALVHA
jgi:alkylhydroperoxidase family enzyme